MALVLIKPDVTFNLKRKSDARLKTVTISIFWLCAVIGAIATLAAGVISPQTAWKGLTADMWSVFQGTRVNSINPIKILILFFSMTAISVFLDELGFFKYLALKTLKKSKSSQKKLFIYLYVMVSLLTIFTSNDIVILTFTPFICSFCKNADINPTPYIVSEFVAANTWSMLFIIGNPTNIYLASSFGMNFGEYAKYMWLPTILSGIVSFSLLWLIFRKKLEKPLAECSETAEIKDKTLMYLGLIHLAVCIFLLAISDLIGLEMWFLCLIFLISMFVSIIIYSLIKHKKPKELLFTAKRLPWELAPFVLGMFIIVLSLKQSGVSESLANLFNVNDNLNILIYGLSSAFASNLVNNIPMSVLFSSLLPFSTNGNASMLAAVIGSNIGAFLTPVGALAGIMFSKILKNNKVKFSFVDFTKYGFLIAIPTLLAAIGGLYLSVLTFG